MAKEKKDWLQWVEKNIKNHPVDTDKFGLMAQEYAFYRGDQYRVWDQRLGVLRQVNLARETRCIYNLMRPLVNMFVAKMLKGDPIPRFKPFPDNTERSDEETAKIGNGMLQYWWKTVVKGSRELRHQCQWGGITGIGIGKIYYDKTKKSGKYDGDMAWETVNPFHFRTNIDARNDDEMRWGAHSFPKEKSLVEEEFNLPKDSLLPDEKSMVEEKRISGGLHVDDYISGEEENTVIVHDIWMKACRDYPLRWEAETDIFGQPAVDDSGEPKGEWKGGRHVIVAGDKVLVDEDNSEPEMLPFITFRVKPLPDELYGEGLLKDVLTLQRDGNRCESIVQANAALMGNSKWFVNRNSNVLPSALNNEESERVDFDGEVPTRDQGVPVPEQIANRWWDIWRKMLLIVGFNEAGRGDIPYRGSQTSPGVIKQLIQSEEVMFAQDIAEMADYGIEIARRFFYLASRYYAEDRMVAVLGKNRRPEVVKFKASEFKDPDFDTEIGSGFSMSREARMDQMIQFVQTGMFNNIPGIDMAVVGREILEYAQLYKISEETFKDEEQAEANLDLVLTGQPAPFSKYTNFDVHIKVFTDYTKNPEYRGQDATIRAEVDNYIEICNQYKLQQMMEQIQRQVMEKMIMQQLVAQTMCENMSPQTGPGNGKKQGNTASQDMEAGAARRQGTGQPVTDMGQAEDMAPQ